MSSALLLDLKLSSDRHLNRQLHGDDDDDDDDDRGSSSHSHQDGGRNTSSSGVTSTATSSSSLPNPSVSAISHRRSSSGAIAGGVIGALCGIALLTFIFWLWWKRRVGRGRRSLAVLDDEYKAEDSGKNDRNGTILERFSANRMVFAPRQGRADYANVMSDVIPRTVDTPVANLQSQSTNRERPHVPRTVANPDPEIANSVPTFKEKTQAASGYDSGCDVPLPTNEASGELFQDWTKSSEGTLGRQLSSSSLPNPHPVVQKLTPAPSEIRNPSEAIRTVSIDTPEEKRQLVRLSMDGLQMDGQSPSRTRGSIGDNPGGIAELQRRVEALTRENQILSLHAQAPPAYQ